MSTVLSPDAELTFPSYTVVSASAGSGKTYTLTQRFVQLLLSDHVPNNGLRNILAITFTNAAASEMRRRLIRYLKLLALGDTGKLAEAREFLAMPEGRIQEKARVAVDTILAEYSDLQIKTIDSFLTTVFKTSSFEFGFQPDLDIVFDNRPLMADAFQAMTREFNRKPELKKTLAGIVELLTETRTRGDYLWDPYSKIQWEVRKIYSKLSASEKEILPAEGIETQRELKAALRNLAKQMQGIVKDAGAEAQKYFGEDLELALEGRMGDLFERTRRTIDKTIKKPRGGVGAQRYERALALLAEPLGEFNNLMDQYTLWHCRNYYKPYVDAIKFIEETLEGLKKQRGQIFIDDVNRLLRPHLGDERVPDAYLMLGEQIYHFLIDEFQDTSPVQWANLRPLIENSLAQRGSLFVVGDLKQSIYSFRNADWRIMHRLINDEEFPSAKKSILKLKKNWRSHEKIINYATHVFEHTVSSDPDFGPAGVLSGLNEVKQEPKPEHRKKGLVEVSVMDWKEDESQEREKILALIRECKGRGFAEREIAILTPENERVLEVSSWLNEEGIPVLPFSSLDIRTRKPIGELVALIRFLASPADDLAFSTFLAGGIFRKNLDKDGLTISERDIHAFLLAHAKGKRARTYRKLQEAFPEVWNTYFKELFRLSGYLPLYDLVAEIYRTFRLFELLSCEESSLVKFLEVARDFGENERNELRDFVELVGEEGEDSFWQVQVPEGVEAVRVMTIHKAKGLEFPVVIVLFYDRDIRDERYFFREEAGGMRLLRIPSAVAKRFSELAAIRDRQQESDRVDRLNKLYVALTRAQHELYVVSLRGEKDIFPSRFLIDEPGELPLRSQAIVDRSSGRQSFGLRHATKPVDLLDPAFFVPGFLEMERGDFFHHVLSEIEFMDDPPDEVIGRLMTAGSRALFPGLKADLILKSLTAFLTTPAVRPLFTREKDRIAFRETEFATREGILVRMDRVLVDPRKVTVIDFKTGSRKSKEYREQINAYIRVMKEIYPDREYQGLVAYIDHCTVEAV